jgi:hypothetical protein
MNGGVKLIISVALLIISLLGNAWLLSERTQMEDIKDEMKFLTSRLERLTATVGVLTVVLSEHSGIDIPWPFDGSR